MINQKKKNTRINLLKDAIEKCNGSRGSKPTTIKLMRTTELMITSSALDENQPELMEK